MRTRRDFLFDLAKSIVILPVVLAVACNKKEENAPEKHLVPEDDPNAKIFKYTKDGTTSEANVLKTNHDAPVDDQICKNCQFYKSIGSDYGSCEILKGNVTSTGWCTSWAKKLSTATPPATS